MTNGLLLWVDDEIEQLRAQILFLEKKGYEVTTVSNGTDAIDLCREHNYDLVLLDEQMPGISGLETLQRIKEIHPTTPVVMVTKSEEENIMEQAIGQKIADYLIKPVNPNQILLTLKKNIHRKEIETEVTQSQYQQNFQQIAMQIMDCQTWQDWVGVYKRLVHWELELSSTESSMTDMLQMQREEANLGFAKFIRKNYLEWVAGLGNPRDSKRPILSPEIFKTTVFPLLNEQKKVILVVLDNFRYDQWRMLSRELSDQFEIDEQLYCSILPTATQYARNAIFSGLMPDKIAEMFPDLWVDEDEEHFFTFIEERKDMGLEDVGRHDRAFVIRRDPVQIVLSDELGKAVVGILFLHLQHLGHTAVGGAQFQFPVYETLIDINPVLPGLTVENLHGNLLEVLLVLTLRHLSLYGTTVDILLQRK